MTNEKFSECEMIMRHRKEWCDFHDRDYNYCLGFKAGRIAEHKDVLERALNFSLPEIKEKLEQIREQTQKETLEDVEKKLDKNVRFSKMMTNELVERGFENARTLMFETLEALKKERK